VQDAGRLVLFLCADAVKAIVTRVALAMAVGQCSLVLKFPASSVMYADWRQIYEVLIFRVFRPSIPTSFWSMQFLGQILVV
jgi:hypothetical protein